jgi:hypothetical protein
MEVGSGVAAEGNEPGMEPSCCSSLSCNVTLWTVCLRYTRVLQGDNFPSSPATSNSRSSWL